MVKVLVRSNPGSHSYFSGIVRDMRQARRPAFFVRISVWNKGVSGGSGFGGRVSQNFRLTAGPVFGSKLISESQISCDRLFSVNRRPADIGAASSAYLISRTVY